MMGLLKFISHNYYKNLRANQHDGTSTDEKDIIYIADESI